MFKKLILTFLIIAFAGIAVCAGINWYVDPYIYFRIHEGRVERFDSELVDRNERMLSAYLLKNKPRGTYDGIIVGGSKSRPLTAMMVSNISGSSYLSCPGTYGAFESYEKTINYAIDNQDIKNVILHISGRELLYGEKDVAGSRMPSVLEGKPEFLDTVFYCFTDIAKTLVKYSVPSFKERFSDYPISSRDPKAEENKKLTQYLNIDNSQTDSWIGSARIDSTKLDGIEQYYKTVLTGDPSVKEKWKNDHVICDKELFNEDNPTYDSMLKRLFKEKSPLPYHASTIETIKRIKQKCDENNVKLTVVMGTLSITEKARYEGSEYWNFLREVADITDYYDFSYYCDINNNPFNFRDSKHNLDTVSWVIAARLYGYDPYGFGRYVTRDNVDEHLIERKRVFNELKEEYEKTGTVEIPGQNDESDLSVLPADFFEGIRTAK